MLLALFALAWLWRAFYLSRLAASPLADSRMADARSYWDWASYLLAHGPIGSNPFFLAPLYPYVLAGLRALFGDDAGRVLQAQAFWGAAATVLLADTAKRFTRPAVGAMIGAAVAFGPMPVFFDGLVLTESLLFALGTLLFWAVARTEGRRATPADALAWGALIGLLAQGRATAAALLAPAALLAWSAGDGRAAGARRVLVLAAAFTLVCAPAALRNRVVSGEWIPFTYNAGYNLYVGNHERASGGFVSVTGTADITDAAARGEDGGAEADGRARIAELTGRRPGPSASSAWWAERATSWVRAHPAEAARLWLRKAVMLWSRHEYAQIENADEFALFAGPLGLPLLGSFALLGPLAMAGAWLAWRRSSAGRFVVGALVVQTLVLLPFFVTDRYRHALLPGVLLSGAFALDALLSARRDPAALRALAPGAALGLALAFWPVPHLSPARRAWGLDSDAGQRWLEHGRADRALEAFGRAQELDDRGRVRWLADAADSLQRGVFQHHMARALDASGRPADALRAHERAAALAPGSRTIRAALANALAAAGDTSRAARLYASLGRADAGADAVLARGWAAARGGDLEGAERAFAAVVARDARNGSACGALVRTQLQRQRFAAAAATLAHARAAGWAGPAADAHEALVCAATGRYADARRLRAALPAAALRGDAVIADVARATDQILMASARPR